MGTFFSIFDLYVTYILLVAAHCFREDDVAIAIIGEHHLQIETDGQSYVKVETILRASIPLILTNHILVCLSQVRNMFDELSFQNTTA